ncbi:hypothetical protein [Micromonospora orduensis]|uniref:hypothetical protein n=1 Tax=Micromonospora orduensis TaxID=1420891 RepID=UPI0033DAD536
MTTVHLDQDIDLDLDEPATVYETTGWNHLVHAASVAILIPALIAVYAEFTKNAALLNAALAGTGLLFALAVFALVMEYRADHR